MDTRALTGGRDRAKGWTRGADGNWTPSVFDRRRIGIAEVQLVAEINDADAVPTPIVIAILAKHSTSADDHVAVVKNFDEWMTRAGA